MGDSAALKAHYITLSNTLDDLDQQNAHASKLVIQIRAYIDNGIKDLEKADALEARLIEIEEELTAERDRLLDRAAQRFSKAETKQTALLNLNDRRQDRQSDVQFHTRKIEETETTS